MNGQNPNPQHLTADNFEPFPLYFPGNKSKFWTSSILHHVEELLEKYPPDRFQIVFVDVFAGSFAISSLLRHVLPASCYVIANDYQGITYNRLDNIERTEHIRTEILRRFRRLRRHSRKGQRLTDGENRALLSLLYEEEQQGHYIDWLQLSHWFNHTRNRSENMLEFINSPHYNQANFSDPLPSREDAERYMQDIHFVDTDASDFYNFRESIEHDEAYNIPEIPGLPRIFFYILDPPYFQTNNTGYRDNGRDGEQAQDRNPTLRTISQLLRCPFPFMYWNTNRHDIRQLFTARATQLSETFQTFPNVRTEERNHPISEFLAVRI